MRMQCFTDTLLVDSVLKSPYLDARIPCKHEDRVSRYMIPNISPDRLILMMGILHQ